MNGSTAGSIDRLGVRLPRRLIEADRVWSEYQLHDLKTIIAPWLASLLESGDPLAILCSNDGNGVALVSSALSHSQVTVLVPPAVSPWELRSLVDDTCLSVLACSANLAREHHIGDTLASWSSQVHGAVAYFIRAPESRPSSVLRLPSEPHLGQFTSGSTGASLLAIRTLKGVMAEVATVAEVLQLGPDDRVLCSSTIAHSYALVGGLLAAIQSGSQVALARSPSEAADLIHRFHPTVIFGLASTYGALLESADKEGLAQMRLALSAGASLPAGLYQAFLRWSGIPIRQDYGTTETGTITLDFPGDPDPNTVGRPLPHLELSLTQPFEQMRVDGRAQLGTDNQGSPAPTLHRNGAFLHSPPSVLASADRSVTLNGTEVLVRSDSVARWYVMEGRLVSCTDVDGWYHTADLGHMDAGKVRLTGRVRPPLMAHGESIQPDVMEAALMAHPSVQEVAVVPGRDPDGATLVKAVIVAPGVSVEFIRRWCDESLSPLLRPDVIELRDALPRSPAGKLLRKHLI